MKIILRSFYTVEFLFDMVAKISFDVEFLDASVIMKKSFMEELSLSTEAKIELLFEDHTLENEE